MDLSCHSNGGQKAGGSGAEPPRAAVVANNNSFPPTLLVNGSTRFSDPTSANAGGELDFDPDSFVNTVRLSALIGVVLLLVVSAVGTAMLLSVMKIWGNHNDNEWDNKIAAAQYYETAFGVGGHNDRLLHPKGGFLY